MTSDLADPATSEAIEDYLRRRLSEGRRCRTKLGVQHRGRVKPSTVHQEFRVLRRMLNVAIKQKRLTSNPCAAVEFPASVSRTTRKPHYMTASEQERIEMVAPNYLKHAVVIISEMGLRPYKELMPMKKSQVDLENLLVHIPDSKTPSGVGDMPMTESARQAFKARIDETPGSDYLFPALRKGGKKPYVGSLKKVWRSTLHRAGVSYFSLYELRHTFASRLSAGGVSDHFVTQMLRQGDSEVFKRYSQAKLNMMREALARLDRQANQHQSISVTSRPNWGVLLQFRYVVSLWTGYEKRERIVEKGFSWYAWQDSNLRPFAPEANALSIWATGARLALQPLS